MKRLTPLMLLLLLACGREAERPAPRAAARAEATIAPVVVPSDVAANEPVHAAEPTRSFRSPSGNIGCAVSETSAACDVRDRTWTPPAKPATCEFDWGTGVHLNARPPVTTGVTCASDTVLNDDMPVLAYGAAATLGTIRCESRDDGMRCVDTATGHGFTVSRTSYDLF